MKAKTGIGCFVLLLLFCISCKKGGSEHSVPQTEKECLERINEAEKDIQNGKLVLCDFTDVLMKEQRSEKERIELLEKYNITHEFVDTINFLLFQVDQYQCYCTFMREKIDEKFGNNFIDSILEVADTQWIAKQKDEKIPYYYCDSIALYPNETKSPNYSYAYSEFFDKELRDKLIYPPKYVKGTASNDWNTVEIKFMIDKNGNAKITNHTFNFNLLLNQKYESFFWKQIEKIIKKKGWTPAKVRGQSVNSDRNISFYFR